MRKDPEADESWVYLFDLVFWCGVILLWIFLLIVVIYSFLD